MMNNTTARSAIADAILYLGPLNQLTASRAEPALYEGGAYAQELQRRGELLASWGVQDTRDPLGTDLASANTGPHYIDQSAPPPSNVNKATTK